MQQYFDFRSPEQKKADEDRANKIYENPIIIDFYKINKYCDALCDALPWWAGWWFWYRYIDIRHYFKSKYQTYKYGFPNSDCWSLDHTIAKFVLPRLKKLKQNKVGIPCTMFSDAYGANEHYDEADHEAAKLKWDKILDEMIFAFDYTVDDEKYNPYPKTTIKRFYSVKELEEDPNEKRDWKEYLAREAVLEERQKEGLKLFAEHFGALWE